MIQIYALSIILNMVGGLALAAGAFGEKSDIFEKIADLFSNKTFRVLLGGLTFLVGIVSLFSVIPGDLPILGDFFPALASLALGSALIFEYFEDKKLEEGREDEEVKNETLKTIKTFLLENKGAVGLFAVAVSVLHLIFPTVLFL